MADEHDEQRVSTTTKITKAIIPVAGWGTRRLPITKAIEKCMLPIGNRPVIDYCVEQCVAAGITDIYFVVSPDHRQLESYYSEQAELESYLKSRGKQEVLSMLQSIPRQARFHYIVQDPSGAYGTAVPIWLARDVLESDERFVVLFGDGFVRSPAEVSDVRRLIDAAADGAILGVRVTPEQMTQYSALETAKDGAGDYLKALIEKPALGTVQTDLANVSYYVLSEGIMPHIEKLLAEDRFEGEYYLTDVINHWVDAGAKLPVLPTPGKYLDAGNLEAWLEANITLQQQGLL